MSIPILVGIIDPQCIGQLRAINPELVLIPTATLNCKPCVNPVACSFDDLLLIAPSVANPIYLTTNFYERIGGGTDGCHSVGVTYSLAFLGAVTSGGTTYNHWQNVTNCTFGGDTIVMTADFFFRTAGSVAIQSMTIKYQDQTSSVGYSIEGNVGCNNPKASAFSGTTAFNLLTGLNNPYIWQAGFQWH